METPGGEVNKCPALVMMYVAITFGGGISILKNCVSAGTITRKVLSKTTFAGYANFGKTEYNAADIYECSSAVNFYVEVYETEETFKSSSF
jgi:hypothetical protein